MSKQIVCKQCGSEIDPDCCWCGDLIEGHGWSDNHFPVPLGCTCYYVNLSDSFPDIDLNDT
jgi:hypothetical protein